MALALGVLIALIALIYISVASRNLATCSVQGSDLVVSLRGLNKVWAVKNRLVIPLTAIDSVRIGDARKLRGGWRLPGSAIPGLIFAGSYLKSGEWSFFAIRTGKEAVIIETNSGHYRRVIFETSNPYEVVGSVDGTLRSTDRQSSHG